MNEEEREVDRAAREAERELERAEREVARTEREVEDRTNEESEEYETPELSESEVRTFRTWRRTEGFGEERARENEPRGWMTRARDALRRVRIGRRAGYGREESFEEVGLAMARMGLTREVGEEIRQGSTATYL